MKFEKKEVKKNIRGILWKHFDGNEQEFKEIIEKIVKLLEAEHIAKEHFREQRDSTLIEMLALMNNVHNNDKPLSDIEGEEYLINNTNYLTDLAKQVYENNKAKGFWDSERNTGEMLMLVVSELGEAMEALRKGRIAEDLDIAWAKSSNDIHHVLEEHFPEKIKDSFQDEIGDAVIRLLDLCGGLKIDLGFHVKYKLMYNKTRAYKHGKQF